MDHLIEDYQVALAEAGCSPGSGRYGLLVTLPGDIGAVFPYLNALLEETVYDRDNRILVGVEQGRRYAFRPDEIRVSGLGEAAEAPEIARQVVDRVNQVWRERDRIEPCFRERKLPAVAEIYRLLPRTNCRQCGRQTCLVFAAELRGDRGILSDCPPLAQVENADSLAQIERLFSGD
jgi:ArsR family metal-binding transcriptional regulator